MQRLEQQGARHGIFADVASVRYLSGYTPSVETGPNPFEGGPALVILSKAAEATASATLVTTQDEAGSIDRAHIESVVGYPAYSITENLVGHREMAQAALLALRRAGYAGGPIVLEPSVPQGIAAAIRDEFPGAELRTAHGLLGEPRQVKDDAEIALIRRAAHLSSVGQREARRLARPGMTEIALYSAIHARIEQEAGCRVPLLADVVSGERTAGVGGPPTDRVIRAGEPVLTDLVTGIDGYWGDSCQTVLVGGEPPEELRRMHACAMEALAEGIAAARPGIAARDLDAVCRGRIARAGYAYPHHSGHGIGTTYHEAPRIIPGDDTVLRSGMVIALEPGAYIDGRYGVRVEDLILVTERGCEVLTDHDKSL